MSPAKPLTPPPARPPIISYACQPTDFKCISHPHTCVKSSMVCDGIYDCTDHSDEFNCTASRGAASAGTGVGVGAGAGLGVVTGTATGTGTGTGLGSFKRWKKSYAGKQKRSQLWKQDRRKHRDWTAKHQVVRLAKSFGSS